MSNNETCPDMTSPYIAPTPKDFFNARAIAATGDRAVMGFRNTEEMAKEATRIFRREIFDKFSFHFNEKDILEIGTGIGRWIPDLATSANSLTSIDFSEEMIKRARAPLQERSNAYLAQATATCLPFKDSSVDVVFGVQVLMHIVGEDGFNRVMKEAKRVLRPGGYMFFCEALSPDENSHLENPYFIRRTFADYSAAVKPLHIQELSTFTVLDEPNTILLIQ